MSKHESKLEFSKATAKDLKDYCVNLMVCFKDVHMRLTDLEHKQKEQDRILKANCDNKIFTYEAKG